MTTSIEHLEFRTAAAVPTLRLLGCRGTETMNGLFRYELFVGCYAEMSSDPAWHEMLYQPCAIIFGQGAGELVCGIVTALRVLDTIAGRRQLLLEVAPSVALLDLGKATRTHRRVAIGELIGEVLHASGMHAHEHYHLHLTTKYDQRPFVMQREESDWAFLQRWLRHYGICSWFEHGVNGDVLHVGDEPHSDARAAIALPRTRRSNLQLNEYAVADLDEVARVRERAVRLHDVDLDRPAYNHVVGTQRTDHGFGRVNLHGGPTPTDPLEGERVANVIAERRMQRIVADARHHVAWSNHPAARVGSLVTTEIDGVGATLLVTALECSIGRMTPDGDTSTYLAKLTLHDVREPFRPAAPEWPRLAGIELGFVEGAPGDHGSNDHGYGAHPDAQGRYVVRLAAASPGAEALTVPVRVGQLVSGNGESSHFPLRPGAPVMIAYEHGDPDRPYVVTAIGHASTSREVNAPANAYRAVLQSAKGARIELADQMTHE